MSLPVLYRYLPGSGAGSLASGRGLYGGWRRWFTGQCLAAAPSPSDGCLRWGLRHAGKSCAAPGSGQSAGNRNLILI